MSASRDYAAIATQYAQDVADGKILAGLQVRQACARHLADLERSQLGLEDFPFVFAPASAARACVFIEALPHVKGQWARRKELLRLEPWQVFIVASIFGWVERDRPHLYRYYETYICVPRKNGKSALDAGIMLYKFAADFEAAAEVYFGATSEEQAKEVGFKPALAMASKSPALCTAFDVKVNSASLTKPGDLLAVMKPVIASLGDGQSPSAAALEEFHEHKTAHLYNAFSTGMGGRENPLLITVTTAGVDRTSPCYTLQQEMEAILAGRARADRRFVIIYTVDEGDEWTSEAALRKANPNYGVSVNPTKLKSDLDAAIAGGPARQAIFKTKHLNIWVNGAVGWLNMQKWDAAADLTLSIDDFAGEDCYLALDLAERVDFADKVRIFPRMIDGKRHFYLFATHYQNQARVDAVELYGRWQAEGRLEVSPGSVTSFPAIADELLADATRFNLREVPHDPARAGTLRQFVQEREDWPQHVEWVEVPQTMPHMSPAMKEFEAALFEGRIHHAGDPVLRWMFGNVVCRRNRGDHFLPEKPNRESANDGATATLTGFVRANVWEPSESFAGEVW